MWVIWRWWKKSSLFKNWLKLDQMVPPECGDFLDHLQITSIFAHMIFCTNKARFPRFYVFLNFFEFILLSRLTDQNIGLYLKGALYNIFFPNFLSQTCLAHVGHCVIEKLGDWRWWKKSPLFKIWLKLKTKRSLRNAVIFSTTSKSPQFWHT